MLVSGQVIDEADVVERERWAIRGEVGMSWSAEMPEGTRLHVRDDTAVVVLQLRKPPRGIFEKVSELGEVDVAVLVGVTK